MSLPKLSGRKRKNMTLSKKPNIKSGKPKKNPPIVVQYATFYQYAIKKYGERSAVLMQNGEFMEIYSYDGLDKKGVNTNGRYRTNIYDLGDAISFQVSKLQKEKPYSLTNPLKCGGNLCVKSKMINRLLDANYTVVIAMQLNDSKSGKPIQREISEVFSPGVSDFQDGFNYNNVVCIVIENQNPKDRLLHRIDQYELSIGMSAMDVSANKTYIYETSSSRKINPEHAVNEVYRFLETHNCRELVLYLEDFDVRDDKEKRKLKKYFKGILELERYNLHNFDINIIDKQFKKPAYQNAMIKKVFGSKVCGPGMSPIEYLDLECYANAIVSYCCLIDFIYKRNETYLVDLEKPEWWGNESHLVLTHNAIRQLSIAKTIGRRGKNSSLFNIINHTVTNQGKRLLQYKLLHPYLDPKILDYQYNLIEELYNIEKKENASKKSGACGSISYIRKMFREMCDFKRYHRKIQLKHVTPYELHDLIQSYRSFIELVDWFYMKIDEAPNEMAQIETLMPSEDLMLDIREFTNIFYKIYDFDVIKKTQSYGTLNENLFKQGVCEALDTLCENLVGVDERIDRLRIRLCKVVDRVGSKSDNIIKLKTTKKEGTKFKTANLLSGSILKWYQTQIRNAIHACNLSSDDDECLQFIKIIHYKDPIDLIQNRGHNITESDILDWVKKKKIQFNTDNSDEEDDSNECQNNTVDHTYLSIQDMQLVLSLKFKTLTKNVDISTEHIDNQEAYQEAYLQKLRTLMFPESQKFLKAHYTNYEHLVSIFDEISSNIDVLQSHVKTAIRYQYNRPNVVSRYDENETLLPSFVDFKGFRHPIIERVQDDIEYVKNDLKLGRETDTDENMIGMLVYAVNNSGKSSLEKAVALNIVLAQTGSFVPADTMRFRPFKNIITRLEGTDNMWRGQGSFAVEMSELRTVANQANPNSLVLGDEICKGTEQHSAISIMAATVEYLCTKPKANFIFSSHYHELLDYNEIKQLKNLGVFHLKSTMNHETKEIIYEYTLSTGIGQTIFGIEVARSMGYNDKICDRALYFRNKRLKKKQHFLSTKTSVYDSGVYIEKCSVEECLNDACDSHHEKQQQTADTFGAVGHFHKNRKHNIVPLCKKHHKLADKQLLHFEYKMTSDGVKIFCTTTT